MVRRAILVPVALFALTAVLLTGCKKGPQHELVGHVESMVSLLEQHKENPEAAADAVEKYVADNRDELVRLQKALADQRKDLPKEKVADLADDLLRQLGPVMERAHRLMAEYPALGRSERLRRALETVRAQ